MTMNDDKTQRSIVRYVPSPPPRDPDALGQYLYMELKKISYTMDNLSKNRNEVLYAYPERPREGDVIYADGVNLDPSGFGVSGLFHCTSSGQWR